MDLTDRLLEHDHWLTGRLLERARELSEEDLDREIRPGHEVLSFDGPEPTVRAMLDRLVWTKEVWSAAIAGRKLPDASDRSLDGLQARFDGSLPGAGLLRPRPGGDLERRARDDALICDPRTGARPAGLGGARLSGRGRRG